MCSGDKNIAERNRRGSLKISTERFFENFGGLKKMADPQEVLI
jgi:hypothetical protein